jgi:hypothetical protein
MLKRINNFQLIKESFDVQMHKQLLTNVRYAIQQKN